MNEKHMIKVANELGLRPRQVMATVELLEQDATVPFIARYRKEITGSLEEVSIATIRDRIVQLRELDKRREVILNSLEERELITDQLREKILAAETLATLEDIYLPYRPKSPGRRGSSLWRGFSWPRRRLRILLRRQAPLSIRRKGSNRRIKRLPAHGTSSPSG
jgi:transcriptional accessory protein Tex/SPT6